MLYTFVSGDTVFDSRIDIKEKYYYSMYDMTVRGSCSCYGHASQCIPVSGAYSSNPNMVRHVFRVQYRVPTCSGNHGKTWKITKKSSMDGKIMEFNKTRIIMEKSWNFVK